MANLTKRIVDFMMPVMEKMTPACDIITQKISRSMDEKLSLKDRLQIRIHTFGCELCSRYRNQLITMRRMIAGYSNKMDEDITRRETGLSEEAARRIKVALNQQKKK